MSHIIPFTIDGFEYVHTEDDELMDFEARKSFAEFCEVATQDWRSQHWVSCLREDVTLVFSVSDSDGGDQGVWALHRVRPIGNDENVVSALAAPMFPVIASRIPEEAIGPHGEVYNAQDIVDATARSEEFWRRTFSVMEWMYMNPMTMNDDNDFVVSDWRFPSVDDGDLEQHKWSDVKEFFDRYFKMEVLFEDDQPIRTTGVWKAVDPDPGRARGSIYP